jgi:hypothetical protein
MRFCAGSVAFPLFLILTGILLAMDRAGIIQVNHIWRLWPVILIAAGMEKLYLWSIAPGNNRRIRR